MKFINAPVVKLEDLKDFKFLLLKSATLIITKVTSNEKNKY